MSVRNRLRSAARSVLRPLWLVVWHRMEPRIRAVVEHRSDEAWQQHMPAFLNAVSTVGAFGHELLRYRKESLAGLASLEARENQLAASLEARESQLAARIEFVRREMLFEMKYAGSGSVQRSAAPPPSFQPRVVSIEKLAASRQSGLRLNLGCGHIPLDGYLNVDMRALPGVDIIAEVGNVPVEPGTVQELHSAHLLEHFPQEELRRRLLPYWLSLIASGGTFKAIVPDAEAMLAHFAAGDYPFEQFREVLFGAQDYNGDFHFNMFMPRSLQALLEEAGFVDTQVPVQGRRNGLCYEFEINAKRP